MPVAISHNERFFHERAFQARATGGVEARLGYKQRIGERGSQQRAARLNEWQEVDPTMRLPNTLLVVFMIAVATGHQSVQLKRIERPDEFELVLDRLDEPETKHVVRHVANGRKQVFIGRGQKPVGYARADDRTLGNVDRNVGEEVVQFGDRLE
ncbi:hypothetical protein [Paraburkholderia strydomiana]|uniref:hypothetical protein n=1 Tax=Paraburkholderia strydomiana TaxID=1245417 RepID=UPI0038BC56A3